MTPATDGSERSRVRRSARSGIVSLSVSKRRQVEYDRERRVTRRNTLGESAGDASREFREVVIEGTTWQASVVEAAANRLEPDAEHRVIMCPYLPEIGRTFLFTTTWKLDREKLFAELSKDWPSWAADMVRIMTLDSIPVDQEGDPNDRMLAEYAVDIDLKSREYGWP